MVTAANDPITPVEVSYSDGEWIPMQTGNSTGMLNGLSKREYFSAIALQGYRANKVFAEHSPEDVAEFAVADADALINALNKEI